MAKAIFICEDAKGTDGTDPSLVDLIYQVVDDDGFNHQVRINRDSAKKVEDVTAEVLKVITGKEVIDLGKVVADPAAIAEVKTP